MGKKNVPATLEGMKGRRGRKGRWGEEREKRDEWDAGRRKGRHSGLKLYEIDA